MSSSIRGSSASSICGSSSNGSSASSISGSSSSSSSSSTVRLSSSSCGESRSPAMACDVWSGDDERRAGRRIGGLTDGNRSDSSER